MPDTGFAPQDALAQRYDEIAQRFLSMEDVTLRMLICPADELPGYMARRQELTEEIDALREGCASQEPGTPEAARQIESANEQARAAACRIRELDAQLMARLKRVRGDILEKLRTVGKSAGARASRYYQPAAPQSTFRGSI